MNYLILGNRTLKKAEKAMLEQKKINQTILECGFTGDLVKPDQVFSKVVENEYVRLEKAFDIGLTYFEMAKRKMGEMDLRERAYMITVRPPDATLFKTLEASVDSYIRKWGDKWVWYEYVYEQKGETEQDMGKGIHVHIIICTDCSNYFPSHILRDTKRHFEYVAPQCIQVDTLRNLERAKEYIRGIKNKEEKVPATVIDPIWRKKTGIEDLYSGERAVKSNAALLKKP